MSIANDVAAESGVTRFSVVALAGEEPQRSVRLASSVMGDVFAAGGIVRRRLGGQWTVAVVHRFRHGGDYTLPKGKLFPDETIESAARREVREEAGCEVHFEELAGAVTYLVGSDRKYVLLWSMDHLHDADTRPDHNEVLEVRWLAPDEAGRLLTYEKERAVLAEEIRRGRFASANDVVVP